MWPLNMVPRERLQRLHGITVDDAWIEQVQKASVRMNNGGSASFVSQDGLLATNHHVARDILHSLSTKDKDYVREGFLAKTLLEEKRAPQLEVNVLWEMEDVTAQVADALRGVTDPAKRVQVRRATIAQIEAESKKKTGLRSDVVSLYNGGRYHLYRYKRYTDIRIVWAPEEAIAAYGGDVDNYEYPRYSLDAALFRVYENGEPLHTPHHFSWSTAAPTMGETLFVAGHPGSTDRLTTYDRVRYLRDLAYPDLMNYIRRLEITAQQFSGRSPEHARRASDELHSVQNMRKHFYGQLASIQSPEFMQQLHARETAVRKEVDARPALKRQAGSAWREVQKATDAYRALRTEYLMFEAGRGFRCDLFSTARIIVRLAEEDKKPNAKRLEEYGDARRESLLERLYSPAPVYKDFEEHLFADALRLLLETFGHEDPQVAAILGGKSVEEVAREYCKQTMLDKVSARKKLVAGGARAIAESKDPFIRLARSIDARARKVRTAVETTVETPLQDAYERITAALFEIYSESLYPDATFTLRLAYGTMVPYQYEHVPEQNYTTLGGVFAHGVLHDFSGDWALPASWEAAKKKLEKNKTAFNFITTHDTHGGNSGSPVFTSDLKIVGLLFDGLMHTQGDSFMYMSHVPDHTVSVHAQGVYDVLQTVYKANALAQELRTGHLPASKKGK